jgi:hypothetical protein
VLLTALAFAKSGGRWTGEVGVIVPSQFESSPPPTGDTLTHENALRVFPRLSADSAAAMAFALATAVETAALVPREREAFPRTYGRAEWFSFAGPRTRITSMAGGAARVASLLRYRRSGKGRATTARRVARWRAGHARM